MIKIRYFLPNDKIPLVMFPITFRACIAADCFSQKVMSVIPWLLNNIFCLVVAINAGGVGIFEEFNVLFNMFFLIKNYIYMKVAKF